MNHQGMADGYNTVRPHGSLGDMTPAEFTNRPSHGLRTRKIIYQRPENGEQVIREGISCNINPRWQTTGLRYVR